MAFFSRQNERLTCPISRFNNPDFAVKRCEIPEKFVINRRKKVKLNLTKYSIHDDCFRREMLRQIVAEKFLHFLAVSPRN